MDKNAHITIKNIISIVIIIVAIVIGYKIYSKYNYNDFIKCVREKDKTSFSRDAQVKYSKMNSYKLENEDYNDSMFYEKITTKPNTAYKVTCMVKTQNVVNKEGKYTGGAQISIQDTTECSRSIEGTTDWTEISLMFNSKNRTSVDIGFRLGGYEELSKGTAWFSDFKIEEGSLDSDANWNVACFMMHNIEVRAKINGKEKNVKLKMTDSDINDITANIKRLPESMKEISNGKVIMDCDIIPISTPITTISYDEENEYYLDPKDVKDLIQKYLDNKEYDYIYIIARLGSLNDDNNTVLVHDWIGLGGMDYYGIGFSNIRLPDTENSYAYKYDTRINTFPEEVFIHEFLHTLERNDKDYENTNLTSLHSYEQYGFKQEKLIGLKNWYKAYMQNTVKNASGIKVGLTENCYNSKPIHESNFKYSYELNELKEPQNVIEELNSIVKRIKKLFENLGGENK